MIFYNTDCFLEVQSPKSALQDALNKKLSIQPHSSLSVHTRIFIPSFIRFYILLNTNIHYLFQIQHLTSAISHLVKNSCCLIFCVRVTQCMWDSNGSARSDFVGRQIVVVRLCKCIKKMRPFKAFVGAFFVAACLLVVPSSAHVALTFPPARKYDLDFLDNSRTKAPCGMPRGKQETTKLIQLNFVCKDH